MGPKGSSEWAQQDQQQGRSGDLWGDLLGGRRGVGAPVLVRQHPRARQQGLGGLGAPGLAH